MKAIKKYRQDWKVGRNEVNVQKEGWKLKKKKERKNKKKIVYL